VFEAVRLLGIKASCDLNGVLFFNLNCVCAGVSLLFHIEVLSCQPMKTIVRIFLLISVLYTIYEVIWSI